MPSHQGEPRGDRVIEGWICLDGFPTLGRVAVHAPDSLWEGAMGEVAGALCRKAFPREEARTGENQNQAHPKTAGRKPHAGYPWQALQVRPRIGDPIMLLPADLSVSACRDGCYGPNDGQDGSEHGSHSWRLGDPLQWTPCFAPCRYRQFAIRRHLFQPKSVSRREQFSQERNWTTKWDRASGRCLGGYESCLVPG